MPERIIYNLKFLISELRPLQLSCFKLIFFFFWLSALPFLTETLSYFYNSVINPDNVQDFYVSLFSN